MSSDVKHSIAVLILKGDEILAVCRPDNDDELPCIWGLPAGTCRDSETAEYIISRIGHDKLGAKLVPVRRRVAGTQTRSRYRLEMELWEAAMEGIPTYPVWQWAQPNLLRAGAAAGSLCCELALQILHA